MSPSARRDIGAIFDGDDTLWSTEPLYDGARDMAKQLVASTGLSGEEWDVIERRIDLDNVAKMGFSAERFPTSCVQAYDALCHLAGVPVDERLREVIRDAARTVFSSDPPLVVGAATALAQLSARDVRLALLTKGDKPIQEQRVARSGISKYFDVVRIVHEKTAATFVGLASSLGVKPADCWSIGNSVKSDILPALEAGLHAIWVDAHVWEHEKFVGSFSHERGFVAKELSEVAARILEPNGVIGRTASA